RSIRPSRVLRRRRESRQEQRSTAPMPSATRKVTARTALRRFASAEPTPRSFSVTDGHLTISKLKRPQRRAGRQQAGVQKQVEQVQMPDIVPSVAKYCCQESGQTAHAQQRREV